MTRARRLPRAAAVFGAIVAVVVLGGAAPAAATPQVMTRDAIIDLAKSAMGYSYYWGHGSWRSDGATLGSCSGSCPSCTHSGAYGADCSGLAAKVWQVPSPSPITTDAHPYSTYNFRNDTTWWTPIDRASAQRADAFVYNANGAGHIFIYESGDPWGDVWAYECKGCSYGCVHDLRSVSSSYVAIRRVSLEAAAQTGTLTGAVYADHGVGSADMTERLAGAAVTLSSGQTTTAAAGDALWSFDLAPGSYSVTATAAGFQPGSRTCTVSAAQTEWCSVGLVRTAAPAQDGGTSPADAGPAPDGASGDGGGAPADGGVTLDDGGHVIGPPVGCDELGICDLTPDAPPVGLQSGCAAGGAASASLAVALALLLLLLRAFRRTAR
ncbi:MAG TPA: carboxypeptidase-like regulatory domain-containing protein [Polyangia bacterium]|jgi:hypothetical protein